MESSTNYHVPSAFGFSNRLDFGERRCVNLGGNVGKGSCPLLRMTLNHCIGYLRLFYGDKCRLFKGII